MYKRTQKSTLRQKRKSRKYKRMRGGAPRVLDIPFGVVTHQTIGDCIEELIVSSYSMYNRLLKEDTPITIVCGGQSPSYYCLAMMNFTIFNPDRVNIVVLPHSKGGVRSGANARHGENVKYCARLKEKGIELRKNVVIIDGVHSGVGILALQSALAHCYPGLSIRKWSINSMLGISEIPVNSEYILPCEPKFSDVFPRLVMSYYPVNFNNSAKFITKLNIEGNPVAEMIIDIAKTYPAIPVKDTEWFKLNDIVTPEIHAERERQERKERERQEREEREEREERMREEQMREERKKGGTYTPIIINGSYGKTYKCPACGNTSGTAAPEDPSDLSLFTHKFSCPNKFKIPVEAPV